LIFSVCSAAAHKGIIKYVHVFYRFAAVLKHVQIRSRRICIRAIHALTHRALLKHVQIRSRRICIRAIHALTHWAVLKHVQIRSGRICIRAIHALTHWAVLKHVQKCSRHFCRTVGVLTPWVIIIFKAIKKPLNCLSGFDIWRLLRSGPQGDYKIRPVFYRFAAVLKHVQKCSRHFCRTVGVFTPWVIIIFKAIKKPLNCLSGFDIWRPQGDSNPCYRRERAVS
jgi:hypothetical protein